MAIELEQAIRNAVKAVVHEVLREIVPQLQKLSPTQGDGKATCEPLLLRRRDAARVLGMSQSQLHRYTKASKIPCVRVNHLVRYSVEALRERITLSDSSRSLEDQPAASKKTAVSKSLNGTRKVAVKRSSGRKPQTEFIPEESVSKEPPRPRKNSDAGQTTDGVRTFREWFAKLLGVNADDLPAMTNGQLRSIAGVDMATYHNWVYRNGTMTEEAMQRLTAHFQSLIAGNVDRPANPK
jgi:hypothetical protein